MRLTLNVFGLVHLDHGGGSVEPLMAHDKSRIVSQVRRLYVV